MTFVDSSSQSGSANRAINSMELKNFTALGLGLPSARSLPALTRMATSSVEQFNSLATSPAKRRAGRFLAAHVANTACVKSSVISVVPLCNQSLSAANSMTSTAANHFGAYGAGSPGGVSLTGCGIFKTKTRNSDGERCVLFTIRPKWPVKPASVRHS